MRIALVHDWLTGMRGGEKVLDALCDVFPAADLFTMVHVPGTTSAKIERRRIARSPVQWLPAAGRLYRQYLPLFPFAVEQFDLDGYDLVISTSHCAAKSVVVPGRARHLCYCLTPMRYAWDQFDAYFGPERVGARRSAALRPVLAWLARWDRDTAHRVHRYLAISQYVARRIALYYNRQSTIVYPPVDTEFFTPDTGPSQSPISDRVGARALQTRRPRHDGRPPCRRGADRRRRRPRARAPRRAGRRPGIELVGRKSDERDPRALSDLDRHRPARRGRLRDRARGGAGLRPARWWPWAAAARSTP